MGDGGRFRAWDVPPESALQRIHESYVTRFDDLDGWAVSVWLNLTGIGEEAARQLQATGAG